MRSDPHNKHKNKTPELPKTGNKRKKKVEFY